MGTYVCGKAGDEDVSDNVQFFILVGVVALSNFQTSMTLWREYHKGTETIIEHIDKRGSAYAQELGRLASNDAFGAKNLQGNGFIMVDDCATGNAVFPQFGDELFKIGGNFGENQIKPVLPNHKGFPSEDCIDSFLRHKSRKVR